MSCSSDKRGYRSRKKALRAAELVRHFNHIPVKYAYLCSECGEWHLTSGARRQKIEETKRELAEPLPRGPRLAKPAPAQPWEPRPSRYAA